DNYTNIYPTKVALGQFHQKDSHPVWLFQNADGGYSLDDQVWGGTRKLYPLITEEELRGKWHKIEINVKWSRDDSGWFKVWVNGNQKVDYSGQTMEANTVYFKYGIYRSFLERYRIRYSKTMKPTKDDIVPTQTVFYKNVSRANSREDLLH
ncbi:heparin lyase I family protein, partial [Vibrio sp. M260118]|uniref:heparin lyase I family protein n=1 Tax=Vibrio sp. M260118 TaxID=3020896 RepID=UPI002F41F99D